MPNPSPAEVASLSFRLFGVRDELVECPYQTPWRSMPCLMFNQWNGPLNLAVAGQDPVVVPANHGVLLPSGVKHYLGPQVQQGQIRCRWFHLQFLWMGAVDPFLNRPLPMIVKPAIANRLTAISARLENASDDLVSITKRHVQVFRLLQILLRIAKVPTTHDHDALAPIAPALRFIEENLHRPFPRVELANTMHVSEGRFHDVFVRAIGIAPMQYVTQRRLQLAQRLLSMTDAAVQDIAGRCGFSDAFHFSRSFKTYCGMSPRQYRFNVVLGYSSHHQQP